MFKFLTNTWMTDRVLETPEKYQDFKPFKFIIYSGKIGEQVPQSNWSRFAGQRLFDKRISRNWPFHDPTARNRWQL
ncbi:MAG TPA: hypothetical protein VE616_01100 [Candidatus Udaeobacter sp.]|nr:hypothetical protein [Candidatus Udaeobacter sp.]